jgi:hypothetical protein
VVIGKKIICVNSVYELIKGHYAQLLRLPLLIERFEDEEVPVVEDLSEYSHSIEALFILHHREQG